MDRVGPILLIWLAGCAASVPRTVPRVVNGRVEQGAAVSPYAYRWFIEGELQAAQGRHDRASMAFETATAAPSSDVLLITRLAEEYEMTGASRRADRTLTVARRFYPSSARVALTEGRILRARGASDEALAAFGRANRLAPGWSAPVVATAELLASRGLHRRAAGTLIEHLKMVPAHRAPEVHTALVDLAYQTEDPELLLVALQLDARSAPAAQAERAARLALDAGKPAQAVRILRGTLDTPQNVELWLTALVRSGHRIRAVEFLASPEAARWVLVEDRAEALVELHNGERALELLAAAERSPRVQHARGRALLVDGEHVRAATELAEVPFGAAAYESSRVGFADCTMARGRTGAAAEALSTTPHLSLPVRKKLADIHLVENDPRSALKLFNPRSQLERAALASVFERAGRYEEAAAYYAAIKLNDSLEPRLRARVSAERHAARGLRATAIAILEQWVTTAPEDLYSRVRLVELLQAEGRADEASTEGRGALGLITDPKLRAHLASVVRAASPK